MIQNNIWKLLKLFRTALTLAFIRHRNEIINLILERKLKVHEIDDLYFFYSTLI